MEKNTYVLVRQSWYDTSSYSVSAFWAYVAEFKTKKAAERALKRYSADADTPYAIFEIEPRDYEEEIEDLKRKAHLI